MIDKITTVSKRKLERRVAGDPATPDARDRADGQRAGPRRASGQLWADLMRRSFGFDVLACRRCGGRMRLIALI